MHVGGCMKHGCFLVGLSRCAKYPNESYKTMRNGLWNPPEAVLIIGQLGNGKISMRSRGVDPIDHHNPLIFAPQVLMVFKGMIFSGHAHTWSMMVCSPMHAIQ